MEEHEIIIEIKVVETQFKQYLNDEEEDDKWEAMGLSKPKDVEEDFEWVNITILKNSVWGVYNYKGETIICVDNTDMVINMSEEEAINSFLL